MDDLVQDLHVYIEVAGMDAWPTLEAAVQEYFDETEWYGDPRPAYDEADVCEAYHKRYGDPWARQSAEPPCEKNNQPAPTQRRLTFVRI